MPTTIQRILAKRRIERTFRRQLGYAANLGTPSTYCEKVQWLKLFYLEHDPRVVECTDKYEVRRYLEGMGLGAHLPRLFGVWDDPREIEWNGLPNRFALKLNNGSGRNYRWFVTEKSAFDRESCVRRMRVIRRRGHGIRNGEFHYAKIRPRIVAEEYLGDDLVDYKFYCFDGSVGFLSAESGRCTGQHVRAYYTPEFETSRIRFHDDLPTPERPFLRPANFDEMLALAARLSRGWPLVRVDLYDIAGTVVFGELTFSPESGYTRWNPKDLDYQFGERIDLRLAQRILDQQRSADGLLISS